MKHMQNQTDFEKTGLSEEEVRRRMEQGLSNRQPETIAKTTRQIVRDNVCTLFNAFNFAIGVCIALVGAYRNLLYLGVIALNTAIGIVQELRSKKMVEQLSLISAPTTAVIRGGAQRQLSVEDLVLGDLTVLRMGNQICADARILSGEVEVDESLLTGESEPVLKKPGDSLLSGSFISSGSCRAVVEHVGGDNYAAKIAAAAKKHKKVDSRLMRALDQIVKFTSFFIVPLGVLLVLNSVFLLSEPLDNAIVTTSAALLGMLPKGLVLLTSVSLAVGVIKLSIQKTLVQELFCIETLSRVDTLCLDKTGTLTTGKMKVSSLVMLENGPPPCAPQKAIALLIGALEDNNATFLALKEAFGEDRSVPAVATTPFSSARKWSAATFADFGTVLIGAPEILLDGDSQKLPESLREAQAAGSRVLLVAFASEMARGVLPDRIIPAAAVVISDPIRPDARETLSFFAEQDVQIKIISGDNPATVASIARQAGLPDHASYIDASSLQDEQALDEAAGHYTIFGRVSPAQKRQLVQALQKRGHTVAMTGDGVNDVLALKDADCSIAMASGSDAAKQVSQLVLLESNFSALPGVVMEGRRVVNNVTRTASLFLVKTIFSFLLSFLTLLFGIPYPFVPVQLTLISLLVEGIPAFVLALEPNGERIRGNFLLTVFSRAFPSALIIAAQVVLIHLLQPVLGFSDLESVTLCFYSMGFVWLMQLFIVCRPFNRLRLALWGSMVVLFYLFAYFLRGLFELGTLTAATLPVFLLLAAACYPFQLAIGTLTRAVLRRFSKRLMPKQKGAAPKNRKEGKGVAPANSSLFGCKHCNPK